MKTSEVTRRDLLKYSGFALGGLAVAGSAGRALAAPTGTPHGIAPSALETVPPPGQMRITFCGTWYTPRPNQACNSVFVELGNEANDAFVFDCGMGVVAKYVALGVPYSRMTKIFLTHLHGDHMSDLVCIYCFGPATDRKTPLHVYGPSGPEYPPAPPIEEQGTTAFCENLLKLCEWHKESFSFLPTGYEGEPNGYVLEPHELPYLANPAIAYQDPENGVTISHFPAIHARDGSISYRLDWEWEGKVRSMVFTGDTKPNTYVLQNAQNVDVLIHELATDPSVWVTKETGLQVGDPGYDIVLAVNAEVIANSHTLASAFGYIMSQTTPRLAVATHFPDDPYLQGLALRDIRCFYPEKKGPVLIAKDLQVITVEADKKIHQYMAQVPVNPWYHTFPLNPDKTLADPKYHGPLAQFSDEIKAHIIPITDYEQCEL